MYLLVFGFAAAFVAGIGFVMSAAHAYDAFPGYEKLSETTRAHFDWDRIAAAFQWYTLIEAILIFGIGIVLTFLAQPTLYIIALIIVAIIVPMVFLLFARIACRLKR